MKRPTPASLKRVNAENLAGLGAERLAELLLAAANTRPDLKRRLRMELAAGQGIEHLAPEVDKRLSSLETLTSKVSWRQRPIFLRDLDALRRLVVEQMAALDRAAALERLWRFLETAGRIERRVKDKHGALDEVFDRAAQDLGNLIQNVGDETLSTTRLVNAVVSNPRRWRTWLPIVLRSAPADLAASALQSLKGMATVDSTLVRQLADAAGDVDAYAATYLGDSIREPANAAEVADRLMAADRVAEAGEVLEAAETTSRGRKMKGQAAPNYAWESSCIEYLERSGQTEAAQAARWASFEATLSVERAKAFAKRLGDFQDVEAEDRAFAIAAAHPDFQLGLSFLMEWPAVAEAGRMIEARPEDIKATPEQVELWSPMLRRTKPRAAHLLLRKAAADAFRRREFKLCDRFTLEAEAITLSDA